MKRPHVIQLLDKRNEKRKKGNADTIILSVKRKRVVLEKGLINLTISALINQIISKDTFRIIRMSSYMPKKEKKTSSNRETIKIIKFCSPFNLNNFF